MIPSRATIAFASVTTLLFANPSAHALFFVHPPRPQQQLTYHDSTQQRRRLFYRPSRPCYPSIFPRKRGPHWRGGSGGAFQKMTATASDEDLEREVSSMKVSQIRHELESCGISTKSFFEKSELVEALVAARKEGKMPIAGGGGNANAEDASPSSTSSSNGGGSTSSSPTNRQERIQREIENCFKLKIGELKKELESYGASTSYFEKSEFVRAVAEARVNGPPKTRETFSSTPGGSRASGRVRDELKDPSYRDVIVTKFPGNKSLLEGKIIEIRSR